MYAIINVFTLNFPVNFTVLCILSWGKYALADFKPRIAQMYKMTQMALNVTFLGLPKDQDLIRDIMWKRHLAEPFLLNSPQLAQENSLLISNRIGYSFYGLDALGWNIGQRVWRKNSPESVDSSLHAWENILRIQPNQSRTHSLAHMRIYWIILFVLFSTSNLFQCLFKYTLSTLLLKISMHFATNTKSRWLSSY